jgi:hypothetical protein
MAIFIQKVAKEFILFKPVNCSKCFGCYFTHHQQLITLYLQYLALMGTVLLAVMGMGGRELIHVRNR